MVLPEAERHTEQDGAEWMQRLVIDFELPARRCAAVENVVIRRARETPLRVDLRIVPIELQSDEPPARRAIQSGPVGRGCGSGQGLQL